MDRSLSTSRAIIRIASFWTSIVRVMSLKASAGVVPLPGSWRVMSRIRGAVRSLRAASSSSAIGLFNQERAPAAAL